LQLAAVEAAAAAGAAGVVVEAEAAEAAAEAAAARGAAGAAEVGGGEAAAGEAVAAACLGVLAAGARLEQVPTTFFDPGPGWPGLIASTAVYGDTRLSCEYAVDRVTNAIGKRQIEKRQQASRTTDLWQPKTPGTGRLELSLKARVQTS
jgi:hypothetical protein